MDKLRSVQVNPVIPIVAAVVIVLGLVYFYWIRPEQKVADIQKNWTSPEAAAARAAKKRGGDE